MNDDQNMSAEQLLRDVFGSSITLEDRLYDAALQFGRAEKKCSAKMFVEAPLAGTPNNHPDHLRTIAASRLLGVCREITASRDKAKHE